MTCKKLVSFHKIMNELKDFVEFSSLSDVSKLLIEQMGKKELAIGRQKAKALL